LTENFCHRGTKNSEITRLDQGRLSAGTRGGDSDHRGSPDRKVNRCIGVRHFASPEDKTSGASEFTKSRETIRTVHLEEDAWRRLEHSGDFPKRKSSIDISGVGKSGIPWTRSPCNSESRSLKFRQGRESSIVGASCQHSGESGFERSAVPRTNVFRHLKPRSPDRNQGLLVSWAIIAVDRAKGENGLLTDVISGIGGSRVLRTNAFRH
jgi:hypothetical protein